MPSQSLAPTKLEKLNDKLKNYGGKLWCDQAEEDSEEGESFEDNGDNDKPDEEEQEQEEQSVNDMSGRLELTTGENVNKTSDTRIQQEGLHVEVQTQNYTPSMDIQSAPVNHTSSTVNHKIPNIELIDPGGIEVGEQQQTEELPNGMQQKLQPKALLQDKMELGLRAKKGNNALQQIASETHALTLMESGSKKLIPRPTKNQVMATEQHMGREENQHANSRDLDEESIAQNLMNVSRRGDLSPRHMEKITSAGRGRRKQSKDI